MSTASTPATFTTGGSSLKNVAIQYIQQPNVSSLQALETALATTINATILELDTPTQMMELCNTLAQSLQAHASLEEYLSASRVFTNLAAMNTATQVIMTATIHDNQKDGVTF
jgi:molybdopterin-guanine dinucleotide biosynthesis protein A